MYHVQARLLTKRAEAADFCVVELEAPEIAATAQPGQFVHLRVSEGLDPLLRRPFSIMLRRPGRGTIQLLVRLVGRGTKILSTMAPGTKIDLLGPLGNPFPEPPERDGKDILLVAGGIGVAPLIFLADVLQLAPGHWRVRGLYGAKTNDALAMWGEFASRCEEFYVATEDGSAGWQGLVTDLLAEQLARGDVQALYTCGPRAMMAEVARHAAKAGLPCYASLEQWMGCGVGACMGCVVKAADGSYLRVCRDGPVFEARLIDWREA